MTARAATELKVYVIDKSDLKRFFWMECIVGPAMYIAFKKCGAHEVAAIASTMAGTTAIKYVMNKKINSDSTG